MIRSLADVVIESERLRLLPTSEEYASDVFAEFTPAITTYVYTAPSTVIEDTLDFLRKARAEIVAGTELQVVILDKETGEFLGHGGIHHAGSRTPELGIWIKQSAQGHHYGREAVAALCRWAFDNLDFDYVKYPVDRRNIPSRLIPESLGGRVEDEYELTGAVGNFLDIVEYRIYRKELAERTAVSGPEDFSQAQNYETQIQKMPVKSPKLDFR
jgi:RimJ/RimL family protein N-acetyltransferase